MEDNTGAYRLMLRSRFFEEKVQELFSNGLLHGTTHLNIGQEASHTGLALALEDGDWIVPTHRCHGFNVARGSSISAMFSELMGSRHGLCMGVGGSMHMTDVSTHDFGSSAVVGSSVALASGLAFALERSHTGSIAVAIMGDGASSRGVVHECMNLASVWSLPVLFYCENNHYGMSASSSRMIAAGDISSRAAGYGIKAFKADGNDWMAVYDTVRRARAWMLSSNEPAFVEVDTYRQCGHSKSDHCIYRSREEEEAWKLRDPIAREEERLHLGKEAARAIRDEERRKVEEAYEEALSTRDDVLSLKEASSFVLAPAPDIPCRRGQCHSSTYRLAIREALDEILSYDPRATLIGEDVGLYGGCFGVTKGLAERHPDQVLETPVSEEAFTGLAAGAASLGEHPIVEIMYGDFMTLASDPLVNHAAKLRFMSAGQLSCPMVVRTPMGSGTGHGSQHTQCLETLFLGVSGLKIVAPSDPFTAKALLKSAVADPNPVLFFEHKALYDTVGEVGDSLSSWPIGKAQVLSHGDDVTLVSYSHASLSSRKAVGESGLSVDHIDLVSIQPLDWQTVEESLRRTGRLLIVQDTPEAGSVGATIVAHLMQDASIQAALRAPIAILSQKDCPIPFSRPLEEAVVPTVDDIVGALVSLTSNR